MATAERETETVAATRISSRNAAYRRALDALASANREHPTAALEQALMDLRIAAFRDCEWPAPAEDTAVSAALAAPGELPEIDARALDTQALRDGILGSGGLIVRNLLSAQHVQHLRDTIDRALLARRVAHSDDDAPAGATDDAARWYARARGVGGGPQQFWAGSEAQRFDSFGSIWTADCPAAAQTLVEVYQSLDLPRMLREYFCEEAVLSVKKWVLRKARPKTHDQSGWHQDGRFLGDGIRTVNLWIALSHCGAEAPAPGMEIIADRRREIHATGTDGAVFDWVVGPGLVERLARETPVLSPEFQPGDALFFDHYNLHRTQCNPRQSEFRYAVESWFFAASSAPAKQVPLVL